MVFNRFRRKKTKPTGPAVSKEEFLNIKPVRNPYLKWEKKEDGAVRIIIPLQEPQPEKPKKVRKKKKPGLLDRLTPPTPSEKKIDLDKIGSIVWEQCDGQKTMAELVEYLHGKFKMMPSEAEVALNTYFNQLSKRGLVGFILPDETRARFQAVQAEKEKEKG